MNLYIVVGCADNGTTTIEGAFNSKSEAERYVDFKNKYKTILDKNVTFKVIKTPLLEKANLEVKEENLCVYISAVVRINGTTITSSVEYSPIIKEEWHKTKFKYYEPYFFYLYI